MESKDMSFSNSNKMWSSMFLLPEHREAWKRAERERSRQVRPVWDEQRLEGLTYAIQEAAAEGYSVLITVFGEFGNTEEKGLITRIDHQPQRVRLEQNDDYRWIKLEDIVDILRE